MPQPRIVQSGLHLRQLLPEAQIIGSSELVVRRFVKEPGQVRPGDVWVAVPISQKHLGRGAKDSRNYCFPNRPSAVAAKGLALALARGAAAVVTDCPINEDLPVPLVLVPDVHEAWGRICQAQAGQPSKTLRVIAVTGRLGTAATCWLLKELLAQAGYRPGLLSALGYFDGTTWHPTQQGLYSPEVLASQLARMVHHQCTHALLELRPGILTNRLLAGMQLEVVCVCPFGMSASPGQTVPSPPRSPTLPSSEQPPTKISKTEFNQDEKHSGGTARWLPRLQAELFRYLKTEGFSVLSIDDPVSSGCLPNLEGPVLTVGQRHLAEITGLLLEAELADQTFLLHAGADIVPVRTRRIGKEHITSCLLTTAIGLAFGLELPQVVRALEAVEIVPGHLERIERGQPFTVFLQLDYSVAQVQNGLHTLRRRCKGRLWCVAALGCLPQKKVRLISRLLLRDGDRLLLTEEQPSGHRSATQPPAWTKPILAACTPPKQACWIADRGEAIFTALQQAQPGDCVLVLSRLPTTYPALGTENSPWDDRAVVHTCLEHLYPSNWPGD
ncbi:MAG: hypothetical protein NZ602_01240 [Thermoguttaceae bacterium]|nr:hypothetical protein [Thermoguttaceae bacterium]MDW8038356.1 hypothetical protein [Thermoguttaceae bacterium]